MEFIAVPNKYLTSHGRSSFNVWMSYLLRYKENLIRCYFKYLADECHASSTHFHLKYQHTQLYSLQQNQPLVNRQSFWMLPRRQQTGRAISTSSSRLIATDTWKCIATEFRCFALCCTLTLGRYYEVRWSAVLSDVYEDKRVYDILVWLDLLCCDMSVGATV